MSLSLLAGYGSSLLPTANAVTCHHLPPVSIPVPVLAKISLRTLHAILEDPFGFEQFIQVGQDPASQPFIEDPKDQPLINDHASPLCCHAWQRCRPLGGLLKGSKGCQ